MLRGRDGGGAMVMGSRRSLTLCASGGEMGALGEAVRRGPGQPGQLRGAANSAGVTLLESKAFSRQGR